MEKPSRWVINSVVSLPSFVSGRVVLLGDAVRMIFFLQWSRFANRAIQAHAMTPHQASGAGQAIEVCIF